MNSTTELINPRAWSRPVLREQMRSCARNWRDCRSWAADSRSLKQGWLDAAADWLRMAKWWRDQSHSKPFA